MADTETWYHKHFYPKLFEMAYASLRLKIGYQENFCQIQVFVSLEYQYYYQYYW